MSSKTDQRLAENCCICWRGHACKREAKALVDVGFNFIRGCACKRAFVPLSVKSLSTMQIDTEQQGSTPQPAGSTWAQLRFDRDDSGRMTRSSVCTTDCIA